jgi:hypothetical protein
MVSDDLNDEVEKVLNEAEVTAGESPTAGPGGKPGPGSADPEPSADLDAEKLVGWIEMGLTTAAMAVCGMGGVSFDATAQEISSLSPEERARLLGFAPYALPYVPQFLKHSDLAGACYFGALTIFTANSKLNAMKYYIMAKTEAEGRAQGVDQGGEPPHVGPIAAPMVTPAAAENASWD